MKYLLPVFILLSYSLCLNAQNITNYTLTSTSGQYIPITGGVQLTPTHGDFDEGFYANIPIGFEFVYMGQVYSTTFASTNGFIGFGFFNTSTVYNSANNNLGISSFLPVGRPFIAPLWDNLDMDSSTGAAFIYQTSGNAPNRVFTAEWRNAEWNWFANASVISIQLKLYERTGAVEFIYRDEPNAALSPSATIGIGGFNNTEFLSLNNTSSNPSVSSTTSFNGLNNKPANGQTYTFTPPVPPNPTTFSTSLVQATRLTANWASVFGATRYAVYYSTDNVNFQFGGITSSTQLPISGLTPNTLYYLQLYAISEGGFSTIPATTQVTTLSGALSGTYNIPGTWNNITAALDSIKLVGIGGPIILELQPNYSSTNERYPITFSDSLGTSSTNPLTIRPAANVTSPLNIVPTSVVSSTINFFGARSIILDGRAGGMGASGMLMVRTNSFNEAIAFNGFNRQTIVQHLRILPTSTTLNNNVGVYIEINFSNSQNQQQSNGEITIQNCVIGDSNMFSNYGIYSIGWSLNALVSAVNIENNFIFNCGFSNSSSVGAAIYLSMSNNIHNSVWNITGNHIYNLLPLGGSFNVQTYYGIYSNARFNRINNNYIGGSAPFCGGSPLEIGPVSANNSIAAIFCQNNNNNAWSSIQGNTINNIFWPTSGTTPFTGIFVQTQTAFVGDTIGNIIGDTTGVYGIFALSQNQSITTPNNYGIRVNATNSLIIKSNIISGINSSGTTNNFAASFTGILGQNAINASILDNTIGSVTHANNIRCGSTAPTGSQQLIGIQFGSTGAGVHQINNNTIANLTNLNISSNTQNYVCGISVTSNTNSFIESNNIFNLSSASTNPSVNNFSAVTGILLNSISGSSSITANKVYALRNTGNNSSGRISGITSASTSGNPTQVEANLIHSFTHSSPSIQASQVAIHMQDGNLNVANNMIRLGIDGSGNSIAQAINLIGILKATPLIGRVHHNTIFIGGTVTSTANINTYCIRKLNDGNDEFVNNIFINQRSNATTGGKHYAIGLNTPNNLLCDKNLNFAPLNGGRLFQLGTSDFNTRFSWFLQTGFDENSDSTSIAFINATGSTSQLDLHLNATIPTKAEGNGGPTFVTLDFDRSDRSSLTPVDIGADAGNFISVNITPVPVKWLSVAAVKNGDNILVQFSVTNEINTSYYQIERSKDGKQFEIVGTLKASGRKSIKSNYVFTDVNLICETYFYRVVQVDYNGDFSVSPTTKVDCLNGYNIQLIPNPANDELTIFIGSEIDAAVLITDVAGNPIYSNQLLNLQKIQIDTRNWATGMYFVNVSSASGTVSNSKLMIKH